MVREGSSFKWTAWILDHRSDRLVQKGFLPLGSSLQLHTDTSIHVCPIPIGIALQTHIRAQNRLQTVIKPKQTVRKEKECPIKNQCPKSRRTRRASRENRCLNQNRHPSRSPGMNCSGSMTSQTRSNSSGISQTKRRRCSWFKWRS